MCVLSLIRLVLIGEIHVLLGLVEWKIYFMQLFVQKFHCCIILLCAWRRQILLNPSRILLLKWEQAVLNPSSAPIPIVERKLAIVEVLLYRLRYAASLSMLLLNNRIIIVAAWVHGLLLDLCELRVIRVLKYGFHSAVVDIVGVLSVQVYSPHVLLPDLVSREVVICVVPRGLLVRVDFLNGV